jgi:hypothetical protein
VGHGSEGGQDGPEERPDYLDHEERHGSAVDIALSRQRGGRPATWHSRRFGHQPVNVLAAAIIEEWRRSGDTAELAQWVRPIEDALAAALPAGEHSPPLRAAIADAEEDLAEAAYLDRPCEEIARAFLGSAQRTGWPPLSTIVRLPRATG